MPRAGQTRTLLNDILCPENPAHEQELVIVETYQNSYSEFFFQTPRCKLVLASAGTIDFECQGSRRQTPESRTCLYLAAKHVQCPGTTCQVYAKFKRAPGEDFSIGLKRSRA